ncbi:MAG TPA: hypothetical protein VNC50_08520 [Planctomycetia bacterium]|nr:hypothetical protein [Planctomycetia bacterium]
MILPFFELAYRSPTRRGVFRNLLLVRLGCLAGAVLLGTLAHAARHSGRPDAPLLGEWIGWTLLVIGIVEGALVVGWRMTQLPKSRTLEPLLLSPTPAWATLLGEQAVGLLMLLLLTVSAAPILALLVALNWLSPEHAVLYPALGFAWGCVVGLGLTWWAYEPEGVRKWGERLVLAGVVGFVAVFGLFADRARDFLNSLPFRIGEFIWGSLQWWQGRNPFDFVHAVARERAPMGEATYWMFVVPAALSLFFTARAALRLKTHYLERNYRPAFDAKKAKRPPVGLRPVSWWAVRRVNEYPGRVNLYLAGGAALVYASYLVVGEKYWPPMLGRQIFMAFERAGGVAGFAAALFVLAAVPAAYQYGLWDGSLPERCKRLEVYLPTELDVSDYALASLESSWSRGRGYFWIAAILLVAGYVAGRLDLVALVLAVAAGLALLALYFAIAFHQFARSRGNSSLGFALTVMAPLCAWALAANGAEGIAKLLPPAAVFYSASRGVAPVGTLATVFVFFAIAFALLWRTWGRFDGELRRWYDEHQGKGAGAA